MTLRLRSIQAAVRGARRSCVEIRPRLGTLGGSFLQVEHDVLGQQLLELRIELGNRQQQQPYRLLQLRRHGQLLTNSEL